MYGHVANVSVAAGDTVTRGQQIATVIGQNYTGRTGARHPSWDSHLHFEMRWFLDGGNIYTPATNAYGYNYPACTWLYPGRGYTVRIHPDAYPYPDAGYVDPSDFIAAHNWQPDEALVLVSRNYPIDSEALHAALQQTGIAYLGMIGSARKVRRVFDELRKRGVSESALEKVHAPIGLDIGADSPPEIAVSVLAEAMQVLRARPGGHLRGGAAH